MHFTAMKFCERGFSLPEVLCALVLFVIIMTALLNYGKSLQQGFRMQWQVRQLWRYASEQAESDVTDPLPEGWLVKRQQTSGLGCTHISVTITSPTGRNGEIFRLHCP